MDEPDIIWDVYESPRLDAVAFGKYRSSLDVSRPGILRAAKYNRRGHRASALNARHAIRDYLTSPFPNKGILDAHLDDYKKRLTDDSRSDEQHENDKANHKNLQSFIGHWDQNQIGPKLVLDIDEDQPPLEIGGLSVRMDLDCLIHSESKTGAKRVGGLFLNTQKGEGLGTQDETIAKRDRAGITVALLVVEAVKERFLGNREIYTPDCMHYYVRHNKIWTAPTSFSNALKDVHASGKTAADAWAAIEPPSSFDKDRAVFHA